MRRRRSLKYNAESAGTHVGHGTRDIENERIMINIQ